MQPTPELKLKELLHDFGTAMLVTQAADGELRARPMQIAEAQPDGTLWFFTDRHSPKIGEVGRDAHVGVTMQSKATFLSISGTAGPVEDQAKVAQLWKEPFKVWFPGGPTDPNLVLLKVSPTTCEYWDNSGTSGLKYLIEAGKAYLSGTRPDVKDDPKIHGKVAK